MGSIPEQIPSVKRHLSTMYQNSLRSFGTLRAIKQIKNRLPRRGKRFLLPYFFFFLATFFFLGAQQRHPHFGIVFRIKN